MNLQQFSINLTKLQIQVLTVIYTPVTHFSGEVCCKCLCNSRNK